MSVIELRSAPLLTNIPGQLRALADRIESGEEGEGTCFVVLPRYGEYPVIYGWGDVDGERHPIAQLEIAKAWFVRNRCEQGA